MSALQGVRVLDLATLFAGPMAATILADYGADVIKIEHPQKGDPVRNHGYSKDGVSLWWATIGRNKQTVALNIGMSEGAAIFKRLVMHADVLIENFRPGTLEKWGLSPDILHEINPKLVIARVTGFGQKGPYSKRAGFGTLAEAMSGFASITGDPDGPPTLPPFGLADGIAALATAQAIMAALYSLEIGNCSTGQVIDLAIIEPILSLLGPAASIYDQLGIVQARSGNRSINNAPRNTYLSRDGKWLAISTSAQSVAERVMQLVGHPEVIKEPWFAKGGTRALHADLLDEFVGSWIAKRDADEVTRLFEEVQAAVAPIYDIRDVMQDPQFASLETIITVEEPTLGPLKMQNVLYRLSETPGEVKWPGRELGIDTKSVLQGLLQVSDVEIMELTAKGVISVHA